MSFDCRRSGLQEGEDVLVQTVAGDAKASDVGVGDRLIFLVSPPHRPQDRATLLACGVLRSLGPRSGGHLNPAHSW
jgi:hypothetical protein